MSTRRQRPTSTEARDAVTACARPARMEWAAAGHAPSLGDHVWPTCGASGRELWAAEVGRLARRPFPRWWRGRSASSRGGQLSHVLGWRQIPRLGKAPSTS